jgi:ABC-2 type transport system permease protein
MTWRDVARKDLDDAIRARWLWILSVVTVLAFSAPIVLTYYLEIGRLPAAEFTDNPTEAILTNSRPLAVALVPLLTIVMSYASITRERDSGSIKVLLSLPHARRDIVVGKFLGRTAAVAIPVGLTLVLDGLLLAGTGGLLATSYVVFALATLLLVVTVTGLGVGLSAHMDTTRRAILASIGAYALFLFFWVPLGGAAAEGLIWAMSQLGATVSDPLSFTLKEGSRLLNPFEAYKNIVATQMVQASAAERYAANPEFGSAPIFLRTPFSVLIMLLWTVAPLFLGIRHFDRVDL